MRTACAEPTPCLFGLDRPSHSSLSLTFLLSRVTHRKRLDIDALARMLSNLARPPLLGASLPRDLSPPLLHPAQHRPWTRLPRHLFPRFIFIQQWLDGLSRRDGLENRLSGWAGEDPAERGRARDALGRLERRLARKVGRRADGGRLTFDGWEKMGDESCERGGRVAEERVRLCTRRGLSWGGMRGRGGWCQRRSELVVRAVRGTIRVRGWV